jgi:hypothetical protein
MIRIVYPFIAISDLFFAPLRLGGRSYFRAPAKIDEEGSRQDAKARESTG